MTKKSHGEHACHYPHLLIAEEVFSSSRSDALNLGRRLWSLRNRCNQRRGRPECLPSSGGSTRPGQTRRSAPTLVGVVAFISQRLLTPVERMNDRPVA